MALKNNRAPLLCFLNFVHHLLGICDLQLELLSGNAAIRAKLVIVHTCDLEITLTPYMVLPLFATRFAAYAGGIQVSFIQPHLF